MNTYEVTLHFAKPPVYSWEKPASTKMEARAKARQEAIAFGYKDEVKRVRAGTTQPESN